MLQAGVLLNRTFDFKKGERSFIVYHNHCITIDPTEDFTGNIPAIFLTKAGIAISKLMDTQDNEDGIKSAAQFIKKQLNKRVEVHFCRTRERRILESIKID